MASFSCPPEEFSCSICLENLCDPATIPCGHSYCLQCIQKHWDKAAPKGIYLCPQCRRDFKPRPSLGRNNMLMEAIKKLRTQKQDKPSSPVHHSLTPSTSVTVDTSSSALGMDGAEGAAFLGSLYPQLPSTSPKLCSLHQAVLELYCCDDRVCVCEECCLLEHKGHRVIHPELDKEQELEQKKEKIKSSIQDREKIIQTLSQDFRAHENVVQGLQRDSLEMFADLLKSVESMKSQVLELLQTYEASACNHIEAHHLRLQQEISQLRKQQDELNRLAHIQDSIQFLNALVTVGDVGQDQNIHLQISCPDTVETGVRSALETFRDGLNNLYKESLASIFRCVNDIATPAPSTNDQASEAGPVSSDIQAASQQTAPEMTLSSRNSTPEDIRLHSATHQHPPAPAAQPVKEEETLSTENQAPKTREEMLKFRCEPTLDQNSAYRHIRLSEGDCKATLRAENQNYPEHPDRFLYWRQVMCQQDLAGGPYYWEVEWTGQKVTIGVAYKNMLRSTTDDSSRLGHNEHSWTLYWSGTAFSFWHAGKETAVAGLKARRIGVYLDQHAGVLAFYRVSNNQAHQIYCVKAEFSRPLCPGFRFWSGVGSTITICDLD
ncbi:finTRIM family, member 86 [Hoplias malabaricus]|uniref:finTRIM family, member 86 n=1 Tax=Hoplias malabaricus TaxID=27720 RepID=UPI003463533D